MPSHNGDAMRGRNSRVNFVGVELPLPPEPTQAMPGTPEKIAVMQRRFRKGYHVHHPDDAVLDTSSPDTSRSRVFHVSRAPQRFGPVSFDYGLPSYEADNGEEEIC